ncbi:MAG TPA: hypothetical protein PLB94_03580 [Microbacteriaceae bacterium]|nr:hypothetical protein [Microbacteriaceae bacterium]HQZ47566.1 hypothetical protein [Microbacteriaceae bacterium]HRA07904.1 hypothetical protein [Microbacteriaceae bacterium]
MVAHVLRLRLALIGGAFRSSGRRAVGLVLAALVAVCAVIAAGWALLSLAFAEANVAQAVIVLAGTAVTLAFAVTSLAAGTDDPLDPRRFAPMGLPLRPLTLALTLAAFISVPAVMLALVSVCFVIAWAGHGVSPVVGVLAALAGLVTSVLLAKICEALSTLVLRQRRSRELIGLFVVAIVVVVVPAGVFLASLDWKGQVPAELDAAVNVLGFTPFGAAWAIPGQVAAQSAGVWGSVAVAAVTVAALGFGWRALVHRLLTTVERPDSGRSRSGLGWFGIAPGTPFGAIAARSLVYWWRDGRYLVNIVIIPVAAIVVIVPLLVAGVPAPIVALVPVPLMALFLGWLPHNDVAYDSTAIWMHIASGTSGIADRLGRLIPITLVAVPLLAITAPIAIAFNGDWALLPALFGVSGCLFLCGLGLSSVLSALAPYPAARPGDGPFQQPQSTVARGVLIQGGVLLGAIVLSLPALWWGWLAIEVNPGFTHLALWGGLAIGVIVLVAGVYGGGKVFHQRSFEIMEFAESL